MTGNIGFLTISKGLAFFVEDVEDQPISNFWVIDIKTGNTIRKKTLPIDTDESEFKTKLGYSSDLNLIYFLNRWNDDHVTVLGLDHLSLEVQWNYTFYLSSSDCGYPLLVNKEQQQQQIIAVLCTSMGMSSSSAYLKLIDAEKGEFIETIEFGQELTDRGCGVAIQGEGEIVILTRCVHSGDVPNTIFSVDLETKMIQERVKDDGLMFDPISDISGCLYYPIGGYRSSSSHGGMNFVKNCL